MAMNKTTRFIGLGIAFVGGVSLGTLGLVASADVNLPPVPAAVQVGIGGFDVIKMHQNTLNLLIQKGGITKAEAQAVIDGAKMK